MVPRSSDVKGTEVAVDNQTFVKHGFSYDVLANKVISAANTYSASEKSLPHYKINDYRLDLL